MQITLRNINLDLPEEQAALLAEAYAFASKWHCKQKYGTEPYINHLLDVAEILHFGFAPVETLVVGLLHDVLEDTPCTFGEICVPFGESIARDVQRLTCDKTMTRLGAQSLAYPKIRESGRALIVKLADRLANVKAGAKNDMYRKEHDFFRSYLYDLDCFPVVQNLWDDIEFHLFTKQ